jgi:predicted HicB family RNase H-like nuclease
MSEISTYPLRLPRSIRASVERVSKREGVSINQFVSIAVAEKLAMLEAGNLFQGASGAGRSRSLRPPDGAASW